MPRKLSLSSPSLLSLLPALLLVAACGPPAATGPTVMFDPCQPLALAPDLDATASARAGLAAGMELWTAVTPTRLTLAFADDSGDASATPVLPVHFQAAAGNFHGLYEPATAQIFINRDLTGAPLAIVVAHEVGHAFGLAHISAGERKSVMNPGNLTVEPNAGDADILMKTWGDCR